MLILNAYLVRSKRELRQEFQSDCVKSWVPRLMEGHVTLGRARSTRAVDQFSHLVWIFTLSHVICSADTKGWVISYHRRYIYADILAVISLSPRAATNDYFNN